MFKKFFVVAAVLLCFGVADVFAQEETPAPVDETKKEQVAVDAENASEEAKAEKSPIAFIAAGIAVGLACIAGGMAVGKIGAAAMGAMSENPELSGKALPFVGLAEGICLWGFLVALLIIIL